MKMQQLICFREVSETQSFTQAAKNLFMAQPGVSYNIRELEKELGVPLFARDFNSKNRSVLTPYGEALQEQLKDAVSAMEDSVRVISDMRAAEERGVRITFSHNLVPGMAFDIWQKIRDRCADIYLSVNVSRRAEELESELLRGKVDVALYPELLGDQLAYESLFRVPLYVYLPRAHPLAERKSVKLRELTDLPLLFPAHERRQLRFRILQMMAAENLTPVIRDYHTHQMHERLLYVALGLGYSIAAGFPFNERDVSRVALDEPGGFMEFYMIWNPHRSITPRVQRLMDAVRETVMQTNME